MSKKKGLDGWYVHQCNMCGKWFNVEDYTGGVEITKRLGYGSRYDEDTLSMRICIDCLEEIIDRCVIDPIEK